MSKINFTPEHKAQLDAELLKAIYSGTVFKGFVGTVVTAWDLLYNTTINSLQAIYTSLNRSITAVEALDEWSLDDRKKDELELMRSQKTLVNLVIGYRKHQSELESEKNKLATLLQDYNNLKASTMSPTDQLAALEAKIKALGGVIEAPANGQLAAQ